MGLTGFLRCSGLASDARGGRFCGYLATVGRYKPEAPIHVVVGVANRQVRACTGDPVANLRAVPFDAVHEELGCPPCRSFRRRLMKTPNA